MKKIIFFLMWGFLPAFTAAAQSTQSLSLPISGKVLSAVDDSPIPGASLILKLSQASTMADQAGKFTLNADGKTDTLLVRAIGYQPYQIVIDKKTLSPLIIYLQTKAESLKEVIVSTGYQKIPRERATGSFDFIDNKMLNRVAATDVLNHIENLTPGLLFNKGDAKKTDPFLIRGRSTIFANAQPLIVVDNFPYDGNLNNINPNDVESVTVLKDAAAASIWGARAANGIIVITTKKGETAQPRVEFNVNTTIQQRPDLRNVSAISSTDFIDFEKYLFSKGFYQSDETYPSHPALTPVVELLIAKRDGKISPADADAQIEALKKYDVRNDLKKYFYQPAINQQYGVNVSGNTRNVNYYMSAGYDRNLANLVGQSFNRISLRTQNQFRVTDKLQFDAGISYIQSINHSGNNPGYNYLSAKTKRYYPYAQLADDNGNPLPFYGDYRKGFIDTAGGGRLMDWTFSPLKDIHEQENKTGIQDYVLTTGLHYAITQYLNASINYQYENQLTTQTNWYKDSSYYARDYINNFTQINPITGSITYPVPPGGILDEWNTAMTSHQGRLQLGYNRLWQNNNQIVAIAGYEIKSQITTGNRALYYGYDPTKSLVNNNIDYRSYFPQYSNPNISIPINGAQVISKLTDHFLSYFANASYALKGRYILSMSGRVDEANLFGVKANQKGTPLWSMGGSWMISNESFYKISWLPRLTLRTSFGYNGNISRKATAFTTIYYHSGHLTPLPVADVVNPPNENLRWEKVGIFNTGVDFETIHRILSGSIEYYQKQAIDLIGQAPVDPTRGIPPINEPYFYGNVANMKGSGIDITLTSKNINKSLKWRTRLIFSHNTSVITKYLMPKSSSGSSFLSPTSINPVVGRPIFSMYSFKWDGLNPKNGNPVGYFKGEPSENYSGIYYSTPLDSLVYNGPVQPVTYGAILNTFDYQGLSLSFNISYKVGYYFRTPSIFYNSIPSDWTGSGDYSRRWQKPGDELVTHVPSIVYPFNYSRENFYNYSEILVQRADNIRLEDISLSYEMDKEQFQRMPFKQLRFYLNVSNLGILWKANGYNIDPYFNNVPADGKEFTIGVHAIF